MNRNVLVRIATPEPARLWSGAGDLFVSADAIETEDGARYLGGGELLSGLDDVEQLINGTAARIDLSVSGVTLVTAKVFAEEAPDLKGAALDVGVAEFDDLWQLIAITWQARYRVDKATVTRGDSQRTISISMASDDTGRSRSSGSYWTDAAQQRKSPGDRIFDRVAGINAGTTRTFGPV